MVCKKEIAKWILDKMINNLPTIAEEFWFVLFLNLQENTASSLMKIEVRSVTSDTQ